MSEKIVLKGDDAIALWKAGKDTWNQWAKENPEADVDFTGANLSEHRTKRMPIDFTGYIFPNGDVSFSHAIFGDGDVKFSITMFGDGNVSFSDAIFGDGNVDFNHAMFGAGNVSFSDAQFGDGHVIFTLAKFGDGNVSFDHARFRMNSRKKRVVSFYETSFGTGNVSFCDAQFGDGHVSFCLARFGAGNVHFNRAMFGTGNVDFALARFSGGNVHFNRAMFGDGSVNFQEAQLVNCRILIRKAKLGGDFIFSPVRVENCTALDFSSVSVDGELSFGEFKTSCVIDLRHSKLNRPIDLDQVDINYELESENWKKWPFHRAAKPHASTCFRRLKKLAKEADDHQRALDFYAKEMRSSYGHSLTGWKLALFFAYDKISDYGRSLLYPFLYLVLCTEVFGIIYWWKGTETTRSIYDGLTFSLGHAVPLYAGSREARTGNANALFGSIDKIPDYIHVLTVGQGLICGVFLFLIALALRNHFRS